jgi:hypothetical protein
MEVMKTCENGHQNEFLNKFCNKCGIEFKTSIKPEFGLTSSKIKLQKHVVIEPISKAFLINDDTLIYKSDRKYYLLRFSDYKNETLTDHPMWDYGTEIEEQDSLSSLYLIKDDAITSISKRFFDNNLIYDNVDSVLPKYIDASIELKGKNITIVTLNSVGYAFFENNVTSLNASESFKFEFPLHSLVFDDFVLVGQHGAKLELFVKSLTISEKYVHALPIEKVILSAQDVIFLDQKGDVYTTDKRDFTNSVNKLPRLKNVHSILVNNEELLAISYDEITIVDLNTTDTTNVIKGTFEQDKVWFLGKKILTLEKNPTINSYSICLYKPKPSEGPSRILNRHDFDDIRIQEVLYVKESLSKLIINFRGSDNVKYLAMVEV